MSDKFEQAYERMLELQAQDADWREGIAGLQQAAAEWSEAEEI